MMRMTSYDKPMPTDYEMLFSRLIKRYGAVDPETLIKVLVPLHIPIRTLDKRVYRVQGERHWRASFTLSLDDSTRSILTPGRTGKFVSHLHVEGLEPWREICKGRILSLDPAGQVAEGEIYFGSTTSDLEVALERLTSEDYLELDQFGASAKFLSSLTEASLATVLESQGYEVLRMPEDMAKHIDRYANYDFQASRGGKTKKIEVKSLWGTDTRYARLIHSKSREYPTSSCKFATQDFFAVSLFLRTGNIRDFAFARSVPRDVASYGLPRATAFPDHVNQNPLCSVGDGTWVSDLSEIWDLP